MRSSKTRSSTRRRAKHAVAMTVAATSLNLVATSPAVADVRYSSAPTRMAAAGTQSDAKCWDAECPGGPIAPGLEDPMFVSPGCWDYELPWCENQRK